MVASDISPYSKGRENTVWGVSLMMGYLGYRFWNLFPSVYYLLTISVVSAASACHCVFN
ncbi:hypothetical protein CK203_007295 [Vitis vinifera]|uniref:Uncharacterized protein n=1 Tax=Vitis vinifera TaxID=29760 RepID=A0A438G131_VITVI|nr:hypothetical protein CK203_007295 [Vitis vinifera]